LRDDACFDHEIHSREAHVSAKDEALPIPARDPNSDSLRLSGLDGALLALTHEPLSDPLASL
jgi:hypothetical protein